MAIQLVQDIHLSDESLWAAFQDYWNDTNYIAAVNLLNNNSTLATKRVSATWLNALTALVYTLENNSDPTFKADRIIVSFTPPSLDTDEVYFQLEESNVIINVYTSTINTSNTSVVLSYDDILINFVAFQNLQRIDTDVAITGTQNGGTVTFTLSEAPDDVVTCLVFSSASVTLDAGTVTYPSGTSTKSFTGTLLNAFVHSGQNIYSCDITISNNSVTFTAPQIESGVGLVCRVISIANTYIGADVGTDSGTISTTDVSTTLDCDGYLINAITTQSGDIVKTDIQLDRTKVIISTVEEPDTAISALVYYT